MDSSMNTSGPAPRMPLQLDIDFRRSYARKAEQAKLRNISLSGAYLQLGNEFDLSPRDKIVLDFTVSGRKRKIHASVVWRGPEGCGIQFHHTNNRDQQIVDDLMYFVENSRSSQRSVLDTIFKKVS